MDGKNSRKVGNNSRKVGKNHNELKNHFNFFSMVIFFSPTFIAKNSNED